jgi:putative phosphoesterase
MKILHISDTHVGNRNFFDEQHLLSAIEFINGGNYDLIVHSGDVTQSGQKQEFREAEHFLNDIQKPLIVVPGNHDTRSGGLYLFEQYIGETNGHREIGNAGIIYVNSAVADSDDGRIGRVQFEMLRRKLQDYKHKELKILILHHHLLPVPMSGRERNVLSNAGDVLDLVLKSDVDLVLLGHKHYPNIYKVENTVFVNAGTLSGKKTRYGDVNSYNEITLEAGKQDISIRRVDGNVITRTYSPRHQHIFTRFGKRRLRIIHLSNTFISENREFLEKHFQNAASTINSLEPDLLVHCGGIVFEGIQQDYSLAAKYLSAVQAPVLYSPAGRDINYLGYHLFSRYFGTMDQSFSDGYLLCAGISSAQYDSNAGTIGNTARKKLIARLKNSEERVKIVFLHHNIVPIPHSRNRGLLEDSGEFLRDLVDAGTDIVLTGTSSHPYAVLVEDTLVVNANSLSSIYQRSIRGNSFNIIDIFENTTAVFEVNSLWGKRRLIGLWDS